MYIIIKSKCRDANGIYDWLEIEESTVNPPKRLALERDPHSNETRIFILYKTIRPAIWWDPRVIFELFSWKKGHIHIHTQVWHSANWYFLRRQLHSARGIYFYLKLKLFRNQKFESQNFSAIIIWPDGFFMRSHQKIQYYFFFKTKAYSIQFTWGT